jgi:hypothetical protein
MIRGENDQRIDKIKAAVETIHRCKAVHDSTALVVEKFRGETVWEGLVESFGLFGATRDVTPPAKRCYGWTFNDGKEDQFVAVLEKPPVTSPETAVKAYVASLGRK